MVLVSFRGRTALLLCITLDTGPWQPRTVQGCTPKKSEFQRKKSQCQRKPFVPEVLLDTCELLLRMARAPVPRILACFPGENQLASKSDSLMKFTGCRCSSKKPRLLRNFVAGVSWTLLEKPRLLRVSHFRDPLDHIQHG